ncbi:MAG: nitrate transporter substrate-binding protein [Tardiphaga sp.]|nr:nitrate transporter substrate-binding protein [Tardiphaga sp.]
MLVACLLAGVMAWAMWRAPDGRHPPRPESATALYLDGRFGPPFAGEMMADRRKLFGAAGVNILLRPMPDDRAFFASIVRDRALGVTTGEKFLLARWRGEPVTAFGASFLDTDAAVFAFDKSGIRSPRDLIGKRLGYRAGAEALVVYDAMMAQLGLPRSQVQLVPVSDVFGALRRGEVDAAVAVLGEQPAAAPPGSEKINLIKPQDYGIHVPGLVYFASSDLVRDRPSVIRRALQAIIRGWQQVYDDPDQAARMIAEYDAVLSPPEVRFALDQQRDLVRPVGTRIAEYDQSRWNTLRDILLFAKLGTETGGLSEAVNYDFLRDVYRRAPEPDGSMKSPAGPD